LQSSSYNHVIAVVVVAVLLSLLHRTRFHLECTVSTVIAINILIAHAVQRTTHSIELVHSAVSFSIAMMHEL